MAGSSTIYPLNVAPLQAEGGLAGEASQTDQRALHLWASQNGVEIFDLGQNYWPGSVYPVGPSSPSGPGAGAPNVFADPYLSWVYGGYDLLIICDANVLPTTANPLNGWQTTNEGGHVVVPSTRVALESIGRMQDQSPRYAVSTGCITQPSYTPRAAGRKSIFHHTYAALLIEIDVDGEVFFHHLHADDDGCFRMLDALITPDEITYGHPVAIWHREIKDGNFGFNAVEEAVRVAGLYDHIDFISAGQSRTVLGVEHGLHGDIGFGGSKGSPRQFRRFGVKTSSGHTHTPCILDGAYVAGVSAKLFQGYNVGPTTRGHAHIVLYPNGKRGMILMHSDGRFRAMGDCVYQEELLAA